MSPAGTLVPAPSPAQGEADLRTMTGFFERTKATLLAAAAGDRTFLAVLAAAVAIRLALLPWFSDPYNFRVFGLTASMVESGQNPWAVISADPALASVNPWGYPPLYLAPVLGASALSLDNGLAFGLLIRAPLICASVLTCLFVQRAALALGLEAASARRAGVFYILNPFVVLVDTVWGSNDPLPVVFVAGSFYYLVRRPPRADLAALLLGVGIALKVYPVVLLPVALAQARGWAERLRFLAFAALPGVLSAGPLLLISPGHFLNILGVFVVVGPREPSPMTLGYITGALGGASAWVYPLLAGAYLAAVATTTVAHALGRLSLVRAWTFALLGVFLIAPRVIENYYLWPIAAVTLAAAVGPWQAMSKFAGLWLWLPVAASALLYNGARGITGLFYWGLIGGVPAERPYTYVPSATRHALTAVALLMVAVASAGLVYPARRNAAAHEGRPKRRALLPRPPLKEPRRVLALGALAFVVGASVVGSADRPLGPEDFGSYGFHGGMVVYTEEFRSGLLDQTWTYGGAGAYELSPAGNGTLSLDTRVPRGNAYVSRLVPNTTLDLSVTARVDRVDGSPGLLLVARFPAGWIGVRNMSAAPGMVAFNLLFFDESTNTSRTLGNVKLGDWFSFGVTLSPNGTDVRFGTASAHARGGPVSHVLLGQRDAGQNLGGRLVLDRVVMAWRAADDAAVPGLGITLGGLGLVAFAVPFWWWRARRT